MPPGTLAGTITRGPYVQWQAALRDPLRRGRRAYWKSVAVQAITDTVIDILTMAASSTPSQYTMISIDHVHGKAARVPSTATAYGPRVPYVILISSIWEDRQADSENIKWTRAVFEEFMKVYPNCGTYMNYLDRDDERRIPAVYAENLSRLRALKTQFDPSNCFVLNNNIEPDRA
jgi:FAD/FMN-containing dehydrogenase